MAEKGKQKPKETKERTKIPKTPDIKRAKQTTETTKKHGLRKIPVAQAKRALKTLRLKLAKGANELIFSAKELPKIEKALGLPLSKLDKKTLRYRIKMLTVEELERAESIEAGTGARLFTTLEKNNKKEPVPLGCKFQKNDKITVHFRNNEVAEDNYGMRHLFKTQPEIRKVYIKQSSKRGKGREGIATRRSLNGNFYFADGSYAPIFTGTEIEVTQVFTKAELDSYKKNSTVYNVGSGKKRYMPTTEAKQYSGYYGIVPPPTTKDIKKNKEYWNKINGTDYSQSPRKRSMVKAKEYIPRNEREKQFFSKWREIMSTNSKQKLIDMKDEITLRPDDPIVHIPNERRGMRLRTGAALRYALFKQHAELVGHRITITSSYRSAKLQAKLWYRGLARRMREFRQKYPHLSNREVERRATAENRRFIAPPGRSHHNTGGAVDIRVSDKPMYKFRGSRGKYNRALRTGNLSGLSGKDRKAVDTRIYMDRVLLASHFLGTNYFRETWHWNIDRQNGRNVYRNV